VQKKEERRKCEEKEELDQTHSRIHGNKSALCQKYAERRAPFCSPEGAPHRRELPVVHATCTASRALARFVVDTMDFTSGRCTLRRADARMRLIQYITGEERRGTGLQREAELPTRARGGRETGWKPMARGRSQSSILLTESPVCARALSFSLCLCLCLSFSLLDPPVIILGDHIARVLTNSGIQRQRENQPPSGVNSLLFSLTVTVVCLSSALSLARSFSFSLALPLCTFSLSVCLCLPFSLPASRFISRHPLRLSRRNPRNPRPPNAREARGGGHDCGRVSCTGAHTARPPAAHNALLIPIKRRPIRKWTNGHRRAERGAVWRWRRRRRRRRRARFTPGHPWMRDDPSSGCTVSLRLCEPCCRA